MSRLEEQLRKAEAQAATKRARDARENRPKGGPVAGPADDKYIRYHATLGARHKLVVIAAGCTGVVGGIGAILAIAGQWRAVAILCGFCFVPVAVAIANLAVKRGRAIAVQKAWVASVPFAIEGYLETLREPRWWSAWSYSVRHEPKLFVRWKSAPARDQLQKLGKLARANVKHEDGVTEATFECEGYPFDPWKWVRDVVDDVLVPLAEVTPVERARVSVKRTAEYQTSD